MLDTLPGELTSGFAYVCLSKGWYGAEFFTGAKQESASDTVQIFQKIPLFCFPTAVRSLNRLIIRRGFFVGP